MTVDLFHFHLFVYCYEDCHEFLSSFFFPFIQQIAKNLIYTTLVLVSFVMIFLKYIKDRFYLQVEDTR